MTLETKIKDNGIFFLFLFGVSVLLNIMLAYGAGDNQNIAVNLSYDLQKALERLVELEPYEQNWQDQLDNVNKMIEIWETTS